MISLPTGTWYTAWGNCFFSHFLQASCIERLETFASANIVMLGAAALGFGAIQVRYCTKYIQIYHRKD